MPGSLVNLLSTRLTTFTRGVPIFVSVNADIVVIAICVLLAVSC